LDRLLRALDACEVPHGVRVEVRVVDNDPHHTAAPVVESLRTLRGTARELRYDHEPRPGFVHVRNRAIEVGPCDLVAWIDDDEWPEPAWLVRLLRDMDEKDADVVCGPVLTRLGAGAPRWLVRGRFGDSASVGPGTIVDWTTGRTGNTVIRGSWFYHRGYRFDPAFSATGGEDADFFSRLDEAGARLVSSDATVYEEADGERLTLRWHVERRMRTAGNYARISSRRRNAHPAWLRLGSRAGRCLGQAAIGLSPIGWARPEVAVAALFSATELLGFVRGLARSARS